VLHVYFGVDLDAVWDTVSKDAPLLEDEVLKIIKEMGINTE